MIAERALVSVIIPTRNRHQRLRRAIETVLTQTYSEIEVIVVDDESDPPVDISDIEIDDERVKVIRSDIRLGAGGARNLGVSRCHGELVTFLDDDDEYLQEKIEKQASFFRLQPPNVAATDCGREVWRDGERIAIRLPDRDRNLKLALLREPTMGPPTVLIRRDVFLELGGFDPTLDRYEDWEFWLRVADRYEIAPQPDALVRVWLNPPLDPSFRLHLYRLMKKRLEPYISALPWRQRSSVRLWHLRRLGVRYLRLASRARR